MFHPETTVWLRPWPRYVICGCFKKSTGGPNAFEVINENVSVYEECISCHATISRRNVSADSN